MKLTTRRFAAGFVGLLVIGLGIILYLSRSPQPIAEILPAPNGFEDLIEVEAGWQASSGSAHNRTLLPKLRAGLAKKSQMPLAAVREAFATPPAQTSKALITGLIAMAESELAAGRSAEAALLWSDALRFGPARVRGGAAIHLMIGIAGEKRILNSIETHRDRLAAADRRALAVTLRQLDSSWESAPVVFARDLALGMEQVSPGQRVAHQLAEGILGSLKKVEAKTAENLQTAALRRASLARDLEQ